jgi:hypothetical protein
VLIVATTASLHFIDRAKDYDSKSWDLFESIGGKDLILSDDMVYYISLILIFNCLVSKWFVVSTHTQYCVLF